MPRDITALAESTCVNSYRVRLEPSNCWKGLRRLRISVRTNHPAEMSKLNGTVQETFLYTNACEISEMRLTCINHLGLRVSAKIFLSGIAQSNACLDEARIYVRRTRQLRAAIAAIACASRCNHSPVELYLQRFAKRNHKERPGNEKLVQLA